MKKLPNHRLYIQILRRMTPEQRLMKAFELTKIAKDLFRLELRERFPSLPELEFRELLVREFDKYDMTLEDIWCQMHEHGEDLSSSLLS